MLVRINIKEDSYAVFKTDLSFRKSFVKPMVNSLKQPVKQRHIRYFKYRKKGYSFLRTNELISDGKILLTDSTHLLIFDPSLKELIWKIKLSGFGHQKANKDMPFLYKAAWIGAKK